MSWFDQLTGEPRCYKNGAENELSMKKNDTVFFPFFCEGIFFFNRKIPSLTAMHGKFADSDIFCYVFQANTCFIFSRQMLS